MFYIQLSLAQNIDCALFLQRVEKARSESSTQSQNVNRIEQERDYKGGTKRFIFIHQTITLKQHNQRNLSLYFFATLLLIFFLLKSTISLAFHNSPTPQTLYLSLIQSSPFTSFLISSSSQKHCFYTAITMLLPYNIIAFTT